MNDRLLTKVGLLLVSFFCVSHTTASEATVAAASSLRPTLDRLVEVFEQSHPGDHIVLVYGASGRLTTQILHGAPFDLFMAANTEFPEQIALAQPETSSPQLYAAGQLVMWSLGRDAREIGWQGLLKPEVRRIAIAQPEVAPYGQRAKEALMHYGIWDQVQNKLVYGESVSQTARMVLSGAADVAILAASHANQKAMQQQPYMSIDVISHAPLNQAMIVTARGENNPVASAFAQFVMSSQAQSILSAAGFLSVDQTRQVEQTGLE